MTECERKQTLFSCSLLVLQCHKYKNQKDWWFWTQNHSCREYRWASCDIIGVSKQWWTGRVTGNTSLTRESHRTKDFPICFLSGFTQAANSDRCYYSWHALWPPQPITRAIITADKPFVPITKSTRDRSHCKWNWSSLQHSTLHLILINFSLSVCVCLCVRLSSQSSFH